MISVDDAKKDILEVRGLSYTYPDGNTAIQDMDFVISEGESVGLIGANGAGKSTLLMLLTGLLFPTKGEVFVGGVGLTKKNADTARTAIGLVFQDPDDQLFMGTVAEDVAFGPRNLKLGEAVVQQRVTDALDAMGVLHLQDRSTLRLSGGEKRAVSIATILAMEPALLAMDEPTASLDPRSRRRLIHQLQSLGHTKLIASHDLDMIWEVCSRVIILKDGRIARTGPAQELLMNERLMEDCALELPLSLQRCRDCPGKGYLGSLR